VVQFLRARRTVRITTAEPVVLSHRTGGDAEVRDALAGDLDALRRALTGPVARSPYRTADMVLADPDLEMEISRLSRATGRSEARLRSEAARELGKMMARLFPPALEVLDVIFNRVWPTLYDGVEVEPRDLSEVKEAARRGPILLLPTHRSHIDYLLLSWIFHHAALPVPHIAAGRNLSFWPLGPIFASAGAFFIPRTLVDRPLERAVLRAYAHRLIEDGHHIEIFLEGTRSRSGKMLPLHTGLLSMLLERGRELEDATVSLLPVALCYERVIEEGHYAGEQAGASKEPESLTGLLKTSDVLASAYGRLVVRFGTPMTLDELERDDPAPGSPRSVKRIAYRMAWEMISLEALTPTGLVSMVLLQCSPLGIDEATLFDCALFYLRMLDDAGKPIASTLQPCVALEVSDLGDETVAGFVHFRETLYQAIHLLAEDESVSIGGRASHAVYSVRWDRRLRLDYYRNGAIGPLAAPAIVCRVLGDLDRGAGADVSRVRERCQLFSRILRHEFVFDPRRGFDENFERTLSWLAEEGIVERGADRCAVRDHVAAERLAACVEPALETYRLVAMVFVELVIRDTLAEWEVVVRAFNVHDRLFPAGRALFTESRNRTAVKLALKSFVDSGLLASPRPRYYTLPDREDAKERLEGTISVLEGE
jgi:glycerol-3-phosphate O-acyltransferase